MNGPGFDRAWFVDMGVVIDLIGGKGYGAERIGGCGLVGKGLGKRDGGT